MMKKRIILIILFLLFVAGIAAYLVRDEPLAQYNRVARHILVAQSPNNLPDRIPTACGTFNCKEVVAAAALENKDKGEEPDKKEEIYGMFQVDDRGNLLLNETTRLNIEKLSTLSTPEELADKMDKLSTVLPDTAHRQVTNLIDYFDKCSRDIKRIYPPDVEPANVEDLLEQLKGTHDLRQLHFGADVARAFFAEEEKQSLQLLYLMTIEKDKDLSLDEKAQRAQQTLLSNPELAAMYDPDRK